MKNLLLLLALIFSYVALSSAQETQPAANKALDRIAQVLSQHTKDLIALSRVTRSGSKSDRLSDVTSENQHLEDILGMFGDEVCLWGLMNDDVRTRSLPILENSRKHLESTIALMLISIEADAVQNHAPAYAAELVMLRNDYRKVRAWITAYRFRLADEHFPKQP